MKNSIFETEEFSSLFEETPETTTEKSQEKPTGFSLFGDDETDENEDPLKSNDTDSPDSDITLPSEDTDEEDDEKDKKPVGRKKKERVTDATPYGEAIQTLIKETEDFLVYEGEDERVDYSKQEFVELIQANIDSKVEQYVESTLQNIVSTFSPSIQKIIKAELKGVKVKDILEDIKEYEELESIPSNPTVKDKEGIVKRFYKELAKEKGKSDEWVNKTVERIIDNDDLDSEYDDAVEHFDKKIQERIDAKAKAKEEEQARKQKFREHRAYVVNEVLKDNELFNIPLKKQDKQVIADVLAGFVIRNSDQEEVVKLNAIIDELIYNTSNPKEAYKRLALMTLAAVNPEGMSAALSGKAENAVTEKTVKQLKVADKNMTPVIEKKKEPVKQTKGIFG